jgi:hypothetical protein
MEKPPNPGSVLGGNQQNGGGFFALDVQVSI